MTLIEAHPFLMMIIGSLLTLLSTYSYNRWLSKSSRVSKDDCSKNQALCMAKITAKVEALDTTIVGLGTKEFHITATHTLKLILMTLAELCETGEGCEERTKDRIRQEMLK